MDPEILETKSESVFKSHPETGRGMWHRAVAEHPDRPFLLCENRTWSYAEADTEMRRLATGLSGRGIGPGTRTLVGMSNRARTVFVHMALREIGAVLVALVPGLTLGELEYQVNHSEGEYLIVDDPIAETLLPALDRLPEVREVIAADAESAHGQEVADTLEALRDNEPLETTELTGHTDMSPTAILYTSGSTAQPKGVVIPAGGFYSGGKGYADRFDIGPDDNFLIPMTLAHGLGAFLAQSIAIYSGGRLTVSDRFSPSTFWSEVGRHEVTVTLLFPAQTNLLVKLSKGTPTERRDTPLRLVISHAWHEEFRQHFGVEMCTVWGSTETGTTGAGSVPGTAGERGEGFLGKPLPEGTEIAIFGPDGKELPVEATGEIALRHPHILEEYLKDPGATSKALRDGWLLTGDLGSLTEEGELYFRGREKNMIKRSGENISPEQIEGVLSEHPGVIECLALGVSDPMRTEELAVVIVTDGEADPGDFSEFVAGKLAKWKAPRYVRLDSEPMPRLGSGKIDRSTVVAGFEPDLSWDREAARNRG